MVQRTYTYSPALIRKAIWELTWLTQGGVLLGLVVLLLIALFIAIGDHPLLWMSGFIAGIAITYFLLILLQYLSASRKVKAYEGIEIQLGFYERSIAVNSLVMSSSLPWSSVTRLQTTRNFLFLTLVGSSQPVLVPISIFSSEDIEFIKNQFKTNQPHK
ncbi:YcxB family protein [bacterium]|nr:YcxB family protein [bacterium]